MTYIFKSSGQYLGFTSNDNIFSRDGVYLGWLEGENVWDSNGTFRGKLTKVGTNYYILKNEFIITPIPRIPKISPISPVSPIPQANILPIILPIGYQDGF